jgi:hypothetical protein
MGQPITVIETHSRRGVVRYDTNRALSGMGHDRYVAGQTVDGPRPTDELARRLFARGGIDGIHINGSVITVDPTKGSPTEGIKEIIEGLYTYYVDGVELPTFDDAPAE